MKHTLRLDPDVLLDCNGFGCKVVTDSLRGHQPRIVFCPLHGAARELRDAGESGLYFIPMGQPEYRILEDAITKARAIPIISGLIASGCPWKCAAPI